MKSPDKCKRCGRKEENHSSSGLFEGFEMKRLKEMLAWTLGVNCSGQKSCWYRAKLEEVESEILAEIVRLQEEIKSCDIRSSLRKDGFTELHCDLCIKLQGIIAVLKELVGETKSNKIDVRVAGT